MRASKYRVITKVSPTKFVKYYVNDLIKYAQFLDKEYKDWTYSNVYDAITKKQVWNFTKYNKPTSKHCP
ncbi:MAG: hypothetical protein SFY32_03130 [Bacteroidota bacterium]|nr:hypothetical protein [Bacteroidota bacterium]